MRAIVCESYDSPDKLKIKEVGEPSAGPTDVILTIQATGLGFVDALTVAGQYQVKPQVPFIPGNEISGTVEKVGDDVKHLRVGQRVLATPSRGGLAEKICLSENDCVPIPQALSSEAAAGFLVNYCTAYHALSHLGDLKEKETILILGASGGVGVAAVDVAKAMGAHVIAAASTKEKRDASIEAGADHVVNYSVKNWRDELKEVLNGKPLNMVYDPVGGDYSEPALRSLGPDGRFLVVGFAAGEIARIPLNLTLLKRCSIRGVNWGGFIAANPGEARPVLTTLLEWIAAGRLNPTAGESYPLAKAGNAMMRMLDRKAIGKVVIKVQD
ncbi:MAG: NADPH:quinone oxidoreductase [Gammaproteobacteria bacterium]|jgi:NADPH2:quinone reductase|nr:NADPH:quinone oxidoreductase [Gammaproteobacteria bacterium]|tara:strand:+ start:1824 stop:2804 length:981 start_codon:yes stop_codon:yes gene_type:complete